MAGARTDDDYVDVDENDNVVGDDDCDKYIHTCISIYEGAQYDLCTSPPHTHTHFLVFLFTFVGGNLA